MTQRSMLCVFLLSPCQLGALSSCHFLTLSPGQARADGGTIRVSEQKGSYRITVFTAPTPVRAGIVDISVLVQEAATSQPAAAVQVGIKAQRHGSASVLHQPATTEAATNKLYHAAVFELSEAGWYSVEVSVDGTLGAAQVGFDVEAAEAPPPWSTMWMWIVWPVPVILLFGVHQLLVRRKSSRVAGR